MPHKYSPYEKEILRQIMFSLSLELKPFKHPDKDLNTLRYIVLKKLELALEKFEYYREDRFFKMLDEISPEARGKEECDCHKGEHKCGCRVHDFNDCKEQVDFAINLIKNRIAEEDY